MNVVRDFRFHILRWLPSIAAGILFASCSEELPPRDNPTNAVTARVIPTYVTGNQVDFEVRLKNEYDETLYGLSSYAGTIELVVEGLPNSQATIHLTRNDMVKGPKLDPENGKIYLDPGQEAIYQCHWNFILDNGDSLYKKIELLRDQDCIVYVHHQGLGPGKGSYTSITYPRQYANLALTVRGQVKLYSDLAASLVVPITYQFQYQTYPKFQCPPPPNPR